MPKTRERKVEVTEERPAEAKEGLLGCCVAETERGPEKKLSRAVAVSITGVCCGMRQSLVAFTTKTDAEGHASVALTRAQQEMLEGSREVQIHLRLL